MTDRRASAGRGLPGALLITALAALSLFFSAPAAAKPVYGVVPQDGALPPADELELMSRGGVGGIRVMAHWGTVEPFEGAKYDWTVLDGMVRESTNRGIKPLLFFYGTPAWAAAKDGRPCVGDLCAVYAPSSKATRKAFARFAAAAAKRYGPGGEFWRKPDLAAAPSDASPETAALIPCEPVPLPGCEPAVEPPGPGPTPPPPPPPTETPPPTEAPCGCDRPTPIRIWQIWNEQNSPKYFAPRVNVRSYAKLLKVTAKGIYKADKGADVILGGMWGPADVKKKVVLPIVDYLKQLYRVKRIEKSFDSIAIHPYSQNVPGSLAQLDDATRVARKEGDRKAGIWVSEIGWAAGGPPEEPYVKGLQGQARILSRALGKMNARAGRYNLRGIFWYSWRDKPGGDAICAWCGNAGLRALDGSAKPAWEAFSRMAKR